MSAPRLRPPGDRRTAPGPRVERCCVPGCTADGTWGLYGRQYCRPHRPAEFMDGAAEAERRGRGEL